MGKASASWEPGSRRHPAREGRQDSPLRRMARRWRAWQWQAILVLGAASLYLGCLGFLDRAARQGETLSWPDALYLSAQLFLLDSGAAPGPHPWQFQVARFLSPALSFYTAAQALAALLSQQILAVRLWRTRGHVVVCGLGRKGSLLARALHDQGEKVVAVEVDPQKPELAWLQEQGVSVVVGDATDAEVLRAARANRARWLVAVCADDGTNAEIAVTARKLHSEAGDGPLSCVIHVVEPDLRALLEEQELSSEEGGAFRLEFSNVYEAGARVLLRQYPAFGSQPGERGEAPHLLVAGSGRLGQCLVVQAAREWWSLHRGDGQRLRITLVGRDAVRRASALRSRYPRLDEACDLLPVPMEIESPEFRQPECPIGPESGRPFTAAYVCVDDNSLSLTTGLALLERTRSRPIRVVVRMADETGLTALLQENVGSRFDRLDAFSLLNQTCTPDLVLGGVHEVLARAIHEDYVRHRLELGEDPRRNPSLVPWESLADYKKEWNRDQAGHLGDKLKAIGCYLAPLRDWDAGSFALSEDEVELLARMEHDRFVKALLARGWRCRPGEKDPRRRTHPGLVPWNDLPEGMKETNRNTMRRLPLILTQAGFQIRRLDSQG